MGPERDMSYPAGDRQPPAYPAYPGSGSRPPRPPLTKRMRRGHWIAIDCVVGGFAALCDAAIIGRDFPGGPAKVLLVLLFAAAVFVSLALRRRAPVIAFGLLVIVGVLLSGLVTAVPAVIFLGAAFALYTVTVERRRRTGIAALALVLAVMVILTVAQRSEEDAGVFVPVALACVIAWMTGYSVRQRRLYVVTLQQQAASSAVAEERLRIARELHDVVAHSMSVIAVQAGYGQYVIGTSPDGAREALGAIQATSRDALEEMRRMLGVLRRPDVSPLDGVRPDRAQQDGALDQQASGLAAVGLAAAVSAASRIQPGSAPLTPAPGLAGLDRLVGRTCGAGVRVTLESRGQARPAPAGVDLSAYRIIQEALTNVVKHAGTGAACVVSIGYTDADLVIRVTDGGGAHAGPVPGVVTAAGTGHGIIGMRERVNLCGGTFRAGPLPAGGFQVAVSLPLPPVTVPAPAPAGAGSPEPVAGSFTAPGPLTASAAAAGVAQGGAR